MILGQKQRAQILPYGFSINLDWDENRYDVVPIIMEWMIDTFGTYDKTLWQVRFGINNNPAMTVYFSDEEDATAFKLRWL